MNEQQLKKNLTDRVTRVVQTAFSVPEVKTILVALSTSVIALYRQSYNAALAVAQSDAERTFIHSIFKEVVEDIETQREDIVENNEVKGEDIGVIHRIN